MIIPSGTLELELEATPPEHPNAPVLLLAHPHPKMGGDMHNKVIDQLFRRSKDRGWGAVRFNFRGAGKSTGIYDKGIGELEDAQQVYRWMQTELNVRADQTTLVGYSFGSWIMARLSAKLEQLRHVVLIAPPIHMMDFQIFKLCLTQRLSSWQNAMNTFLQNKVESGLEL